MGAKHLAVACVLLGVLVSSNAVAQQCISKEAEASMSCEGSGLGARVFSRKPHAFEPPVADAPQKPRELGKPASPDGVTKATPRHQRRLRDIERKLLLQEIQNVAQLHAATPDASSDQPKLLIRLAENYVELESSLYREQIEKEIFADKIRKKNRARSKLYRDDAKQMAKRVAGARDKAIRYYEKLVAKFPDFCRQPTAKSVDDRGCGDEVLYYLAYELEQARRLSKARDVYLKLIERHPTSRYVPNAYLAFGELYFEQAQGDPDSWAQAQQAYEQVIGYPAPKNAAWGYAHYKLGYVHWNQGRYAKAIDHFKKVIDFGKKYPRLPNATGLTDAARRDIVPVYALEGDPKAAWTFFAPLSGNTAGVNDTLAMVEALGRTLMDTGHYSEAITVYRDVLMKQNAGAKSCGYHGYVSKATMALSPGKKAPVVEVLDAQYELYKKSRTESGDKATKLQCGNQTVELLAEAAMAWHLEAVGSGGVRGTNDKATMEASEHLYQLVSTGFEVEQFAKFRFPRIAKEDWPTLARVRYAYGDLLFHQGKWGPCGAVFDQAYDADPKNKLAAEALFTAAECWQRTVMERYREGTYREARSDTALFTPRKLEPDERSMLRAFDRYACNIAPPKGGDQDAVEAYGEILYARARTHFAAGSFDKAALMFRQIALELPSFDGAATAADFYLESLEIMRTKWKKPSCVDPMQRDVPKMVKLHCRNDKLSDNEAQCKRLSQVETDLERLVAEGRVAQAQQGGDKAASLFAEGCEMYLALWKKKGEAACKQEDAACKGYDEILYNAAQACQAGHLLAKAISIRKILLDPQYHQHETTAARKATFELGANYQAIAVYDESAKWYERFAVENPKMDNAARALSDAVVLRLGLGQSEQALDDAQKFNEVFGKSKPQQASQIAFAIAAHHVTRGAWLEAERVLNGSLAQIEQHATADVQIQAHALVGRVSAELGKTAPADKHYGIVRKAGEDIAKLDAAVKTIDEPEARRRRRFAKALGSVGEALFYFAEKERKKADAIAFPTYRGDRNEQDVERFVQKDVREWLAKKKVAIEQATAAYKKVIDLNGGKPPPKWAIAAGAAAGKLWGDLVEDFIDAPYPSQWDQDGTIPNSQPPTLWHELRAAYKAGLAEAVKPHKAFAKTVYDECLEYGILFQYFDGELRHCEVWLSKNYPKEYHVVDELRDTPSRVSSGLAERPAVLTVDGKPAHMAK